jgi:ribonuclease HII
VRYRFVAGIDEAGRGPLAGPVVAAAVILPPGYEHPEINDSKELSPRQRGTLYEAIARDAVSVGIGVVEAPEIDLVNILQATLAAMKEAVLALSLTPDLRSWSEPYRSQRLDHHLRRFQEPFQAASIVAWLRIG